MFLYITIENIQAEFVKETIDLLQNFTVIWQSIKHIGEERIKIYQILIISI